MRILLVDHSRVTQTFWRERLEARGYTVLSETNAEAALETLRSRRVELVLVALTLPGMDGLAFTKALRLRLQHQAIPIILLCSRPEPRIEEDAFESGVSAVVDKADIGALWETVGRAIEEHALDLTGRVLYLEDSPTAAHVMLECLKALELEADHVRTGREALEALERERYDLVIADERLEGELSGSDVVSAIRSFPDERALLPILGVSAANEAAERRALFHSGITDFLGKPALPEETQARIMSLLASRQLTLAVRAERRRLSRATILDSLTGQLSRHAFVTFAEKYRSQAERHRFPIALGIISADGLAAVNETQGREKGDAVVAAIGECIERTSRAGDVSGRYGGAGFAMLLFPCDGGAARARFERLVADLGRLADAPSGLRFVAGYVAVHGQQQSLQELLRAAEAARDAAWRGGESVREAVLDAVPDGRAAGAGEPRKAADP